MALIFHDAKGEQLLFKAITYNQWLLVGRKTFESMEHYPTESMRSYTFKFYI